MQVDHIIVGQGIAGTLLWYELKKFGQNILVVDKGMGAPSSLVAPGIINPVTGREMKVTWKADELIPIALDVYRFIGEKHGVSVCENKEMYRLLPDAHSRNEWDRLRENNIYRKYLSEVLTNEWSGIKAPYGLGGVNGALRVDGATLLRAAREHIRLESSLLEENFDYALLRQVNGNWVYKEVVARNIIFCEGHQVHGNPYFQELPVGFAKGELLYLHTDAELPDAILNRNGFLLPLGSGDYVLGSTYAHQHRDAAPSEEGRKALLEKLAHILDVPFTITGHIAGIRPTSRDRRPLVGRHKHYSSMYIFNGLGTKGYLLAPVFARQLASHLEVNTPLWPEVSPYRWGR